MSRNLNEKQHAAIALLSIPGRGGLTYEEVSLKVGVSRQTLSAWRKQDEFNKELKAEIVRNTLEDLPEIMKSLKDHIVRDGNAALLRTLLQAHGMLTEKVEVDNKAVGHNSVEIEDMKAKIEQFRRGSN